MNDSPGWATPGSSPSDGEGSHGTQPPAPASQPSGGEGGDGGDPKWSAEQPPPGQWSSPTPGQTPPPGPGQPPAGAPQGWGSSGGQQLGHGGYPAPPGGQGGWNQARAVKPGVIPLRPLGLGEILDGAVATMRKHWRSVLPITLVVAVVVQLTSVLIQKFAFGDIVLDQSETASVEDQINAVGATASLTLAEMFIQLVGTIAATAMLTMIFSRAVLGHASSIGGAWRESRSQLPRLFALTLLLGVGTLLLVGVLLLPAILTESVGLAVLGGFAAVGLVLWLWIKLSLASPALMLEKATLAKACARSWKLVKGSWWRIFGITFLTNLITGFVAGIIVVPLTFLGAALFGGGLEGLAGGTGSNSWGFLILAGIGGIIGLTITMPMQSGVTVLLYVDQRIRREALDLELARAAGIENYGTGATAPPTGG
ncbi:glycerophosphoryl diester phosphodiesterase membrane domain-containing protein [Streptomyces sp. ISL-66]|uniref:glycerophosphoryl diester phosphodiesterase membrane domain-containing protein n=1 Tax=Streptomyces sp. ISL-66 TaxID=2819186 RepID=UPI001BE8F5FA|nr:glycerophosphoryl diester phosphodiesterase membrane domain-containing protein [Streptomyces sp. ISL-66]MBT2467187.1 glycerophosphoryl diester phosphodiesterase membrane domain-containing protein [Streptomyces sp. ISL-66]